MFKKYIKDGLITIIALGCAFGLSILFQYWFDVEEHITTASQSVLVEKILTRGAGASAAIAIFTKRTERTENIIFFISYHPLVFQNLPILRLFS